MTSPASPSWKDQLSAAFTAKELERAQRLKDTQTVDTAATPETATAAVEPLTQPEVETPSVTSPFTQEEPATPTQPTESQSPEDDFLRESETDHPEVATLKASLKSGFLKKMADVDKKLKDFESKQQGLLDAQQKAQVLDSLLASPDPAAAIDAARKGLGIAPKDESPASSVLRPRMLTAQLQKQQANEELAGPVEDWIDTYMNEKFMPILMPYVAWIQQQVEKGATSEFDVLAQKYPSAPEFKQQAYALAALAKQQGIPLDLEGALIAVSKNKVLEGQKVQAAARPPAAPTAKTNGVPPKNRGEESYAEKRQAFARALLNQDKEKGTNRFFQNRLGAM